MYTYKILTTDQLIYWRRLLKYYTPRRILRSANQHLLEQPRFFTKFGKRSFSHLASNIWNNLRLEIRLSPTLHIFKYCFKPYLFKWHFLYPRFLYRKLSQPSWLLVRSIVIITSLCFIHQATTGASDWACLLTLPAL